MWLAARMTDCTVSFAAFESESDDEPPPRSIAEQLEVDARQQLAWCLLRDADLLRRRASVICSDLYINNVTDLDLERCLALVASAQRCLR
jgi:hypothetical protein